MTLFAPIFLLFVFNIIVFIAVVLKLIRLFKIKLKQTNRRWSTIASYRLMDVIVRLVVLLGLTWLFGALTAGEASKAFQYMFVIFNGFQGFFLFVHFCMLNRDVRELWIELILCRQTRSKWIFWCHGVKCPPLYIPL